MKRAAMLLALLVLIPGAAAAAVIQIINQDGPGEGFNDSTPVLPEGGNPGTTLGQQRLIVFQRAAAIWGALLRSDQVIKVGANFDPLVPCGSGSGVLGQAGPTGVISLPAPPPGLVSNTWYPIALAEAASNQNINAGNEISTTFNSDIDNGCLSPGTRFWYGIDPNAAQAPQTFALFPVVLHELAHGLGFLTVVCTNSAGCGATPFGGLLGNPPRPDIWTTFLAAAGNQGFPWRDMSDAQRAAGITSDPNLVWVGAQVTSDLPVFQPSGPAINSGRMRMHAPGTVQPGSSVSHFTSAASPNLLMKPVLGAGVFNQVDLTWSLFRDIGWAVNPRDTLFRDNFDAR